MRRSSSCTSAAFQARPHDRPLLRRSCGQVAVAAASAAVPRIDDCTGRSARWRSVRRTAAAARWVRSKFPTTRLSRGAATGAPQPRCENLDFRSFGADPTAQKRGHSPPNGTRDGRRYERATLRRLSTSPDSRLTMRKRRDGIRPVLSGRLSRSTFARRNGPLARCPHDRRCGGQLGFGYGICGVTSPPTRSRSR